MHSAYSFQSTEGLQLHNISPEAHALGRVTKAGYRGSGLGSRVKTETLRPESEILKRNQTRAFLIAHTLCFQAGKVSDLGFYPRPETRNPIPDTRSWWQHRLGPTRSHSEHGSENGQGRKYSESNLPER